MTGSQKKRCNQDIESFVQKFIESLVQKLSISSWHYNTTVAHVLPICLSVTYIALNSKIKFKLPALWTQNTNFY